MSANKTTRSPGAVGHADITVETQSAMQFGLLPSEQVYGNVHFLTGGTRLREAIAIKHAMHQFPLTLEFHTTAGGKEQFLSGVPVTIRASTGEVAFRTLSAGPYLLARLRPGQYEVIAEHDGQVQMQKVEIRANGGDHLVFEWGIAQAV